jgi:hypothetical protein
MGSDPEFVNFSPRWGQTPGKRRGLTPLLPLLLVACFATAISGGAAPDLVTLQQRIDRLEALTARVEALSAIKRLQHAYGHYSELGLWHDFADLFADSGIGHYPAGALDREAIRTLFVKEVGGGRLGLADGRIYPHIVMQPVVTLAADGRSARGRWHIMAMLGGYGTNASWAGGIYENQYVLENAVWKLKEVRYLAQYSGRYDDPGWTATREPTPFHYDVTRVGTPVLDVPTVYRTATPPPALTTLGTRIAALNGRAQRLSDEIEITNLQHAYGYYVDRKMWDDVADLFASDGTMEIGLQGVYAGKSNIRRGLNAFGKAGLAEGEINDHIQLQTIVTVMPDGRTARARGTEIGMLIAPSLAGPPSPGSGAAGTAGSARRALWTQSISENEYVKQDGVWRIKAMHVYPRFIVDAERGWAKDAQPAPPPSREFPPNRPSTETYEIFPRFHIAPFHFHHPVTGRAPQYPEGVKPMPRPRPTAPRAPTAPTSADAIESLIAATERSVERSKAYHAAENLASAYGYYIDEFAWDETAGIFSRDGWKELSFVGAYVGRERIRESLKRRYPNGKPQDFLTLHQIVQPVIHVSADGRSSKIRARAFQLGSPAKGEGSWISAIYENSAVDEGGTWKLSGMDLDYVWNAPSRGGWVRVTTPPAPPQVPMATEFPPDRPLRGPSAAPFPKVQPMPFHYRNPASNRAPALLLP